MLDYVKGSIQSIHAGSITVDIGNIGIHLTVPFPSSFTVGDKANFHLHMHWNAEQGPSLYGFSTQTEKEVFLLVISCSGVGPKLGIAVLTDLGAQAFLEAVQEGSEDALSKVSGIGAKKAEQMIVQLKHKVAKLIKSGVVAQPSAAIGRLHEVTDVLKSLNYSRPEISAAMKDLSEHCASKDVTFDQMIRHALSFLAKRA